MATWDLVVVGGGPGGYSAAARAAELGLKVACVEREARLGGVCLREGCIPTKALLDSSELFARASGGGLEAHGIRVGKVTLNLQALLARQAEVVEGLTGDLAKLLARRGVEVIHGEAHLAGPGTVAVARGQAKPLALEARAVLLATGSEPVIPVVLPLDGTRVVDSTGALAFPRVPRRLGIVGGGYIGLELGSAWARLGAEVTVLEALPRIAAGLDGQVARTLARSLTAQGLALRVKTRVAGARATARGVRVTVEAEGETEELAFDRLLVAVGRRPRTGGLGLAEAGVALDPATGRVRVDQAYQTSAPGVYAVGDLVDGPMLAHKASAEGLAVSELLAGRTAEVDYDAIPSVVYTDPEVAGVGWTEEGLKARGAAYVAGVFPFAGTGRARCLGETMGFAKVLCHRRSGRLLGAHLIGPRASELIAEAALAVARGATAAELVATVHAHPTLAEAFWEACRVAEGDR